MFGSRKIKGDAGCRGEGRQVTYLDGGYRHLSIHFSCAGLNSVQKDIHKKVISWMLEPFGGRIHAQEAEVAVRGICATCPLGPAAQAREDLVLRQAAVDEVTGKTALQQAVNRGMELRLALREAGIDPGTLPPEAPESHQTPKA